MGVYVHIPFCAQKCHYCDFYSIVVGDREKFLAVTDNYLSSLRQETLFYRSCIKEGTFSSLFIGGGTPSLLRPEELAELITFLLTHLPFQRKPEITLEANPNSLTADGLELLAKAGVNRISLGVQAFQNELLAVLGRAHGEVDVVDSVDLIRRSGIDNINIDLIFGLPGQTYAQWEESLQKTVDLQIQHVSCYNLIIEEGTPFHKWYELGLLKLPSGDEEAVMYDAARTILRSAGFEHYEISNFSLPGKKARHNLLYWHNRSFIGLGAAATGYLNMVRYTNVADVEQYIGGWHQGRPVLAASERISLQQEMDETMMVGMRLLAGVSERNFEKRYGKSFMSVYAKPIKSLLQRGLVQYKDGFLKVTERGLYLENMVSAAFLP